MNNYIIFLVLIVVFLILCICYYNKKEKFNISINEMTPSQQTLKYLDMGDHRTVVQIQKGYDDIVILLHANPMNINLWQPLFQTMQRFNMNGYKTPTLIAYDLRGHGTAWAPINPKYNDTDVFNTAWTLEQFAIDCKKVYDNLVGNQKVIICGYGFGGSVAQKYALLYPTTVKKLVILQSPTRSAPGLQEEINYLGGVNGWINRNKNISYLTSEEKWIQKVLCGWFYINNDILCPNREQTDIDEYDTPQYQLVEKMYRQGSSVTTLQVEKLGVATDLARDWESSPNIDFPIHILAATDDPISPPDLMVQTYSEIYNNNRSLTVIFDVVQGKHGFSVTHPDYIAGILCPDCPRVSINMLQTHNRF
jgi:pimeloyl-ACP methyl ester carboxylesterase